MARQRHAMSDSSSPLAPLPDAHDPGLDRFRLTAPREIAAVFRDLMKTQEPLSAFLDGGESFPTRLLGMDPDLRSVYLDDAPDQELNRRALVSRRLVLTGRHYRVPVQFTLTTVSRVSLDDGPAFAGPFPPSILRIQRREFFRLATPVEPRPVCHLQLADNTRITAAIVDISVGGIGIIEAGRGSQALWQPGLVIKDAVVELSDEVQIRSDIEIRNRYEAPAQGGEERVHLGCRFLQLDARTSARIQRYIHELELRRRRLARK